jgi:hypothetical protein
MTEILKIKISRPTFCGDQNKTVQELGSKSGAFAPRHEGNEK